MSLIFINDVEKYASLFLSFLYSTLFLFLFLQTMCAFLLTATKCFIASTNILLTTSLSTDTKVAIFLLLPSAPPVWLGMAYCIFLYGVAFQIFEVYTRMESLDTVVCMPNFIMY